MAILLLVAHPVGEAFDGFSLQSLRSCGMWHRSIPSVPVAEAAALALMAGGGDAVWEMWPYLGCLAFCKARGDFAPAEFSLCEVLLYK